MRFPIYDELQRLSDEARTENAESLSEILRLLNEVPLDELLSAAQSLRKQGHSEIITYSRKVFIPLTFLCRDSCAYCTFAKSPRQVDKSFLTPDDVLAIAKAGERAGCHEALFTLGDKPELRYSAARTGLKALGFSSTTEYLAAMCELVLRETTLLPHVNSGVMSESEVAALRKVSVSQGLMLETASPRLSLRGGPHFGSPDKEPAVRLQMIAHAGRQKVPFTSGILIGIGETRLERIESLLALRRLHNQFGHLQEIIIQNFRAKAHTRMGSFVEAGLEDLLWTGAAARLIFGPNMNIQIPPNLSNDSFPRLLESGINDWGGISPVTIDHVNPEAPWPTLDRLEKATEQSGLTLAPRLAIYPDYVVDLASWVDPDLAPRVLKMVDANGFPRMDMWTPGEDQPIPRRPHKPVRTASLDLILSRAEAGQRLSEVDIGRLLNARGGDVDAIGAAADAVRRTANGETVRYVVNRNINYTNVCYFKCQFCAFSKGKLSEHLRGRPYDLTLEEVRRRAREAWERGATEVCMQGGIHPDYDGNTYLSLLRAVKDELPEMHVHAFSPLEISQGAQTLNVSVEYYLRTLRDAGLGSLPGTAAEILHDPVRAIICPDKLSTRQWLDIIETAHRVGLRTTATIMFGHVEQTESWAKHLLHIRDLQERTRGFTEFVPLPFIHMEAPIYLRGRARKGPTWREVRLMHAVARLALHPLIPNIQASWVKLGSDGLRALMNEGVNDLGGTLMNESISRAAGTMHGQEMPPKEMDELIASAGRVPQQRTTLYAVVSQKQTNRSYSAGALSEIVLNEVSRRRRTNPNSTQVELTPQ